MYNTPGDINFSYVRAALTVELYAIANNLPYYLVSDFELMDPKSPQYTSDKFFTGGNASAVKTFLDLGLSNLSIRVMPGQSTPPDSTTPQTPLCMHGKQVIMDNAQAFLGSENLTNTSLIQNRELGILFSDAGMIKRLQSVFESDFTTPGNSLPAQACKGGTGCATITCPKSQGALIVDGVI